MFGPEGDDGERPVQEVVFTRNTDHWDAGSGEVVDAIRLVRYDSHADVESALLDGTLDAVVGDGVLQPSAVAEFMTERQAAFQTYLTEPLQNRIVILNTAKAPTDELTVRKVIIHGVDKAAIIDKELAGLAKPADSLFPKNAPYCGIDLTPRFDYDFEKATLLNCPGVEAEREKHAADIAELQAAAEAAKVLADEEAAELRAKADDLDDGALAGIVVAAVVAAAAVAFAIFMVQREKQGSPLFTPLLDPATTSVTPQDIEMQKGVVKA